MSQWLSTSKAFTMGVNDWKKTGRDLGFYLLAALGTAMTAWLSGYGQEHPDAYWVPAATSILAAVIVAVNRWKRDNPEPTPEPVPDRPDGLTTKPRTQWG